MNGIVERIISGGQTGPDRAALDCCAELPWAMARSVPKDHKAED